MAERAELVFFRQQRQDGGIRMGIEREDGTTLLAGFQEGPPERRDDPLGAGLLWYVDLRCRAPELPATAEEARAWFLQRTAMFRPGLEGFAEQVAVGVDDSLPLLWTGFPGVPEGIEVEAVCSAIRRVRGEEFAGILRDLSANLDDYLARLVVPELVLR